MSDFDHFDFIKGFAGVDILQAEAIAEVIGRVIAALFKGIVAANVSEDDAHRIISSAFAAMARATMPPQS
jgi:hypothetical protein